MMALVCAFVANAYTVYLNPAGGEWSQNNEKYAVWAWSDGGEGSWYGMSAVGNGLYETEIPDANTNLIFVRMDKNKEGYSWDNKWDQTNNLSYDGTNNLYTITGKENSGNYNGLGEWSSYVVEDLVFTVTVPEGTENCYITGTFNNWTGFLQMEKVEGSDNKFTVTIDDLVKNSVQYKYLCSDSWDYVEVKANGEDTDNRTYNEEDVVAKWKATPVITYPEKVYMVGYNGDYDPAIPLEITGENGIYTAEAVEFTNTEFKLSTAKGTWAEFNAECLYVEEVTIGTLAAITQKDAYSKIEAGTYNITIDLVNNTFLAVVYNDPATAIESVSVDANAPVEYYNLQCVKVANPENGLFIKKQGNKAVKVIL